MNTVSCIFLVAGKQKYFTSFGVFLANLSKYGDELDKKPNKASTVCKQNSSWRMCQPYIFIDIQHSRDSLQADDWLHRASFPWYVECEEDKSCACADHVFRGEKANLVNFIVIGIFINKNTYIIPTEAYVTYRSVKDTDNVSRHFFY